MADGAGAILITFVTFGGGLTGEPDARWSVCRASLPGPCQSEQMSSTDDSQPGPAPDSNQLPLEDTLEERGTDDLLNESYSPPDRSRGPHWGETPYEEAVGEPHDAQLAEEEPEDAAPPDPARQADRAGRLAEGEESDEAEDVGVAGGAATAEEAAMRLVDEDGQAPPAAATPEQP